MLNWIETYVKGLVRSPDQVSISTQDGVLVTQVHLMVGPDDIDLFSGQHNRFARALSVVLSLSGTRDRRRYILKIAS